MDAPGIGCIVEVKGQPEAGKVPNVEFLRKHFERAWSPPSATTPDSPVRARAHFPYTLRTSALQHPNQLARLGEGAKGALNLFGFGSGRHSRQAQHVRGELNHAIGLFHVFLLDH